MKFPSWLVNALKRPFRPTTTLTAAPRSENTVLFVDRERFGSMAELMEEASTKSRKKPQTIRVAPKAKKRAKPAVSTKKTPQKRSTTRRRGVVDTQG